MTPEEFKGLESVFLRILREIAELKASSRATDRLLLDLLKTDTIPPAALEVLSHFNDWRDEELEQTLLELETLAPGFAAKLDSGRNEPGRASGTVYPAGEE